MVRSRVVGARAPGSISADGKPSTGETGAPPFAPLAASHSQALVTVVNAPGPRRPGSVYLA